MLTLTIPLGLRIFLIVGALLYLGLIFFLLKKRKLNVQYSIIWLASAVVLILFAVFPYIVAVLRDIFKIEMPVNLVFSLLFVFVLLLLLSLSIIVTGFATKINRLAQTQALLEKRIRELEAQQNPQPGTGSATPADVNDTDATGDKG